jgi:hypothetical protein
MTQPKKKSLCHPRHRASENNQSIILFPFDYFESYKVKLFMLIINSLTLCPILIIINW